VDWPHTCNPALAGCVIPCTVVVVAMQEITTIAVTHVQIEVVVRVIAGHGACNPRIGVSILESRTTGPGIVGRKVVPDFQDRTALQAYVNFDRVDIAARPAGRQSGRATCCCTAPDHDWCAPSSVDTGGIYGEKTT